MTTWLVRGSVGSNLNGGTSQTVLATGTDGVTNAGNTNLTAASAPFTAGMVGQGIYISQGPVYRTITAFNSSSSITYSGATVGTHSGLTYNVGGAWKTLGNAIASGGSAIIAAGDSIFIGAGVYRETNTVTISGSSGSPISIIGDVDGAVTGDAGEVQVTNYLVSDTALSTNVVLLALGANSYLSFSLLTLIGFSNSNVVSSTTGNNWSLTDCTLIGGGATLVNLTALVAPANVTIDRCVLFSPYAAIILSVSLGNGSGGAAYDAEITVRNSLLLSFASNNSVVSVSSSGTTAKGGGVRLFGCTIIGGGSSGGVNVNTTSSITIPCEVHYCVLMGGTPAFIGSASGATLIEDHNLIYASTPRTNVAIGPGSISNNSYAPLFDIGQQFKWAGLDRRFLSPSSKSSPLLGFGVLNQGGADIEFALPQKGLRPPGIPGWIMSTTFPQGAPMQVSDTPEYGAGGLAVDWQNRPRPSGGGRWLPAVGYMDFHDFAVEDQVNYVSPSTTSAKLVGPGDFDLRMPVDAVSNTISLSVLYQSSYGGQTYPTVTLLADNEIGVSAQIVSAVAGYWGSWQTVTLQAFTPTAAGWVVLRFTSYDQTGTSAVNWDNIVVS